MNLGTCHFKKLSLKSIFYFFSCNMKLNLDYLLYVLWEYLALIRVYTKKPGQPPDFDDGLILRKGVTVEHVCHAIHRTLAPQFKYGLVWVSTNTFMAYLRLRGNGWSGKYVNGLSHVTATNSGKISQQKN